MTAPTLNGEIVGRRAWWEKTGRLWSLLLPSVWPPGIVTARCEPRWALAPTVGNHDAPGHMCSCGLYAYFDVPARWAGTASSLSGTWQGVITAWGDVELHPDGFRAEHARVAALAESPGVQASRIKELARRYGVPMLTAEQFEDDAFIGEFGQVAPLELRPLPLDQRTTTKGDQ